MVPWIWKLKFVEEKIRECKPPLKFVRGKWSTECSEQSKQEQQRSTSGSEIYTTNQPRENLVALWRWQKGHESSAFRGFPRQIRGDWRLGFGGMWQSQFLSSDLRLGQELGHEKEEERIYIGEGRCSFPFLTLGIGEIPNLKFWFFNITRKMTHIHKKKTNFL